MSVEILGPDGEVIRDADNLSRRSVLGLFCAVASSVSAPAWANEAPQRANDFWLRPRRIRLRHPSGDKIDAVYWSDGEIIRSGWEELSWFMRDRVDRKAVYMQPVLLDILYGVCGWLDYYNVTEPLTVTSGYRTPSRNSKIEGAALNGEHPKAGAADVTHPSVSSSKMSKFGSWLGGGGVGWYPHKGFTHLDRGRLRSWRG